MSMMRTPIKWTMEAVLVYRTEGQSQLLAMHRPKA